ncbi:glutamate--cysteine ligase [Natrinema halophilum]|uniref:Glutamate--cysteine ligase n=1 Tax=Natrinema halophilum TaxID=1699371 RepID=A0A7D5GP23_9EURY|nr:glutamate--cysteine ligase [Natrinema halophilum]QLG49933.1 glutamate--cysteine ligase [Natrinema halophilum]
MNTSIEVEYWVVDSDGELTDAGPLADVSARTEQGCVEPLFQLQTPACESVSELRTSFVEDLEDVLSKTTKLDKHLVPFGTPVNGDVSDRHPGERCRIRKEVLGTDFDCTKYCAGTHVRIEKRHVTDQLNTLIALGPALALVNSSPYVRGERVANGARAFCYRTRSDEVGPKHGQRWRYVDDVDEWYRRLERSYEEFETAAVDVGIDATAVEDHFSTTDVTWTSVRLRDSTPAIEWRSPDTALPSQILRLVRELETVIERVPRTTVWIDNSGASGPRDHSRGSPGGPVGRNRITRDVDDPAAVLGRVTDDMIALPTFDVVQDLTESAICDGLGSAAVANYLERMGFSVDDFHPIATQIDGRQFVTRADARDLRLEYASRLEEDVARLARSSSSR